MTISAFSRDYLYFSTHDYVYFNIYQNTGLDGDDHLVVRLIGDNKSNTTMYTFKLFHVGQATISVSR